MSGKSLVALLCATLLAQSWANHGGEGEECPCNGTSPDGSAHPRRAQKEPYEDGGSSTWCGCADDTPTDWDSYGRAVEYMESKQNKAPAPPPPSASSSSSSRSPSSAPAGYGAYVQQPKSPSPSPSARNFDRTQEDMDGATRFAGMNTVVLVVAATAALAMAGKY